MKINSREHKIDCVIIGAGIFGLYAASLLVKQGRSVAIIDKSIKPFSRASSINQARVHNGYHYPRSYETAVKVAEYYDKFVKDFSFAINNSFDQIYAIASRESKTSTQEFINFCRKVGIPLKEINSDLYLKKGSVEAAFLTRECSFDFSKIRDFLTDKIGDSASYYFGHTIKAVERRNPSYTIILNNGMRLSSPFVINASYAGINEVIDKFDQNFFDLKYELCEMVFCDVPLSFRNIGITVMDGNFFSIMPFGNSNFHVLTSVGHTPHDVSYDKIPHFKNNVGQSICEMHRTEGCIVCAQNLRSKWDEMYALSHTFLKPNFTMRHKNSLFEMKAILKASENDDSRPTIIRHHTTNPTFVSVLSGKISTIYDLEEICEKYDRLEISSIETLVSYSNK